MKAIFFAAAVLSLSFTYLPTYAASETVTNKAAQPSVEKIDLNQADAQALLHAVKGIGQKRAEAIVKYREDHGSFKSIEDLAQVRGLGQKFVNNHLTELQTVFMVNN